MRVYFNNKKLFDSIWSVAIVLVCIMVGVLSGCSSTTDENGQEVKRIGQLIFIEDIETNNYRLAYDKETKVIYYLDDGEVKYEWDWGIGSPYYIYENGTIYGAIYEDGEIKPVPFAVSTTVSTN